MDGLTKSGIYFYALPIGILGIIHFLMAGAIVTMLPSFFIFPIFWVYLSGFALLAAAISIFTRKYTRLACLLLALLFFILVLAVDLPRFINNAAFTEISMLLKDIIIAGGALVIAAVSSKPESL